MPRKQRFKPSRKPKPVQPAETQDMPATVSNPAPIRHPDDGEYRGRDPNDGEA
jgi:hypothetical protein